MATRDLTPQFLERRAAAIRKRPAVSHRIISGGGGVDPHSYKKLTAGGNHDLMLAEEGLQMASLSNNSNNKNKNMQQQQQQQPPWVQDVDDVEKCILDIQNLQKLLLNMHAQRVGSVFGKDLNDMEEKIETMTLQVTDKFRYAERLLQKVGVATRRAGGQEATVGANVQRNLAKRLQEQSVVFRQSQRQYLAEVQAQKNGGCLLPGTGGNAGTSTFDRFGIDLNETSNRPLANSDFFNQSTITSSSSSQHQQQQSTLTVVDDLTEAVHSRDKEIAKIAESIEELGSIFKELAVLVIDQGTILDRIDYNMETVVESTKTGIKQLEKAEKSQKNARPLRCIICLSITIFILLFILVLKHRPRRGWF